MALNYSRRIQRPNYQNLNPFEYRIDELSFRKGNPFLQPQYTNNLKLSHTYNYRLTTSFSYSFIKDLFAQVTEAQGNNQNFINVRNVANQRVYNLGISYTSKFNDWWSYYININASRNEFITINPDFIGISQNSLSFYAQNTFKLSNGIEFSYVDGKYNATLNNKYLDIKGKYVIDSKLGILKISFNPNNGETWWVFEIKE